MTISLAAPTNRSRANRPQVDRSALAGSSAAPSPSREERYKGEAREGEKEGESKRCCLTRQLVVRSGMIRFVLSPEGVVVPDLAERLPGRGAWVTASALKLRDGEGEKTDDKALMRALRYALKDNGLKGEKAELEIRQPDALIAHTYRALRKRILAQLGLARRSGLIVSGEGQVRMVLQEEPERVQIFMQASDGAAGGVEKLARLARNVAPQALYVRTFSAQEQGLALGRDSAVHLCVLSPQGHKSQDKKVSREASKKDNQKMSQKTSQKTSKKAGRIGFAGGLTIDLQRLLAMEGKVAEAQVQGGEAHG